MSSLLDGELTAACLIVEEFKNSNAKENIIFFRFFYLGHVVHYGGTSLLMDSHGLF